MGLGGSAHDILGLMIRVQQSGKSLGNLGGIGRVFHDERTHRGRRQFGDARLLAGQHAQSGRHRFNHDIAERFEERRQREGVGGAKQLLDLPHHAKESHA